jgi:hypothetical protein
MAARTGLASRRPPGGPSDRSSARVGSRARTGSCPLCDLLVTVGSAAAWLRDCLEHLVVDGLRMRGNLELTRGLILSERVAWRWLRLWAGCGPTT